MKNLLIFILFSGLFCTSVQESWAHFGMLIPSQPIVRPEQKSLELTLSFSHPFESIGMELVKPARFYVLTRGKETDLLNTLKETSVMDHTGWQTSYRVKRPGVYHFVMEPTPYWEPAEDLFIIHYTRAIVAAYGNDTGWDEPIGLPTEIVPLLRPFGNYAGNSFTGQVLLGGSPVANAEVEVEFYNKDKKMRAPSDFHITQVVRADGNGVFSFTCPVAGWWGFAALNEADYTLKTSQGDNKQVELGAVLWVYMDELHTR